jgi:hypothetical protein
MAAINNIILNTEAEALEDLLSPFIKEQFPLFVQTDYPKLVLFIKAYYEWLEQEGNVGYLTSKLDTVWDVDLNLDEFYSHFKNTYLDSFPEIFAANASGNKPNKKTLLKKIRDFYGNKGTESSYKFLFRILYDSDLEFYYPKNDILKVSDGVWTEPRSIKTTVQNGTDLFGAVNGNIYQYSGVQLIASAFVNSVVQYSFNGVPITEFFITDITGQFSPNASVVLSKDGREWTETAYPVIGEFFVELPGSGYRVGDAVTVTDSKGTGFSAKIDQVGLAGGVKKIGLSNSGVNYTGDLVLNIFSESGSRSAKVIGLRSAITNYPGYFTGNRGKMSSNKKIQDGHYYQDFSYELKSAVSLDTYFGVLKNIIHPTGMRMFGSILLNRSIDNALTTSSQATFYEIPLIGRYTPYTSGTTLDLRANGNTLSGYWLGETGDLYPLGYNPYIGSTTEVGPNGQTTPVGTVFVGTSLGYTYCYVPEGGRTSHNPIGAALGSTSAFYRNKESNLTPAGMDGLVLWLKPENIGVCGSVVNGASMDVWRDASKKGNHAVPPTWSRWNGIAHITQTAAGGYFSESVRSTNPVTKLAFVANGLCGGFTHGRLFMMGLAANPAASNYYDNIDYAVYSYGSNSTQYTIPRQYLVYESGNYRNSITNGASNYSAYDNTVCEVEYIDPNIVYRIDGVVKRTVFAGYGRTFYFDSSFFAASSSSDPKTSVTLLDLSYNGNPVVPNFVSTANMNARVYAGVTLDKLRPVISFASLAGPTGICFNGGVIYSPNTNWNGNTFSSYIALGATHGAGTTAEKIQTGQHFYLTQGITLSSEADIFVVFRPTDEQWDKGVGMVCSESSLVTPKGIDAVLFNRSYNATDRNTALQNSSYYRITPSGSLLYPSATPTGLVGFRPAGGNTTAPQNIISYDPHVSGVCMGVMIGEWTRDANGNINSYLNGDRSVNRSRISGRRNSNVITPDSENYLTSTGLVLHLDGKSSASSGDIKTGQSSNLHPSYGWIETVPPFASTPVIPNYTFNQNITGENTILYATDPFGSPQLVLQAKSKTTDGVSGNNDGGWNYYMDVDPTKTYRFSFWFNRNKIGTYRDSTGITSFTNNINGAQYTGVFAYDPSTSVGVLNRTNTALAANTNYYFISSVFPRPGTWIENEWVLVVCHVYPYGTPTGSNHADSGVYTRAGVRRTIPQTDAVWATAATNKAQFRSYLFYCWDNTPVQWWLHPRVDVVDGTEPTVQNLLDDVPNTWKDISPVGTDAVLKNMPVYKTPNSGYLSFDGANDYVQVATPTVSTVDVSGRRINKFTIEGWIRPDAATDTSPFRWVMASDANGSDNGVLFRPNTGSIDVFTTRITDVNNAFLSSTAGSVPRGKWSHFAAQINDRTVKLFVNGKLNASTTYPYDLAVWDADSVTKWYIGIRYPQYPNSYKGDIANFRAYNRVLGAPEIFQNFNVLRGRFGV